MQPTAYHLRYVHERHGDLVREARRSELAASLAESRTEERRQFLARRFRHRLARRTALGLS